MPVVTRWVVSAARGTGHPFGAIFRVSVRDPAVMY
jgi:hypothetical protein